MWDAWEFARFLMERLQKKSGGKQVSHGETLGFQKVSEEKGEEQEMLTFDF